MQVKKYHVLIFALLLFVFLACNRKNHQKIASLDKKLQIEFHFEDEKAYFHAFFQEKKIFDCSEIAFVLGKDSFPVGFEIENVKKHQTDTLWKAPGSPKTQRTEFVQTEISFVSKNENPKRIKLIFRVFNGAFAFRYSLAPCGEKQAIGFTEYSFFRPSDTLAKLWWHPADFNSFERLFRQGNFARFDSANFPLLAQSAQGLFFRFAESHIQGFSNSFLARKGADTLAIRPVVSATNKVKLPFVSPWRVVQVSPTAENLLASQNADFLFFEQNKNEFEPFRYGGNSWELYTGKTSYLPGKKQAATTENAKKHIDFAARHKLNAVLIEGWHKGYRHWGDSAAFDFVSPVPGFDLAEISQYASQNSVELILHFETGGDVPGFLQQTDTIFSLLKKHKIRKFQVDFAGVFRPQGHKRHGQKAVGFQNELLAKAAENDLLVSLRTPASLASRTALFQIKAGRGAEYEAWGQPKPPEYDCILPFMTKSLPFLPLSGLVSLPEGSENHFSPAKQLALQVIFDSPARFLPDFFENYEETEVFEFLKRIPLHFDTTKVLSAYPGEHIAIARQSGKNWFVALISGSKPYSGSLDFGFLPQGKNFRATVFRESESKLKKESFQVKSTDKKNLNFEKNRGLVIFLEKIE